MLLLQHELADADGPGKLNAAEVARLAAADWGLYTTVTDNLGKTRELLDDLLRDASDRDAVAAKLEELLRRLEEEPKSVAWRLRAKLGRRVRWYELPEEVTR